MSSNLLNATKLEVHKQRESEYLQELFMNLKVLTKIHQPSKEFQEVFNATMFVRDGNHKAFQQVVYYLLSTLPTDIKVHVKSWPILDRKMEHSFKREVLAYINKLNSMYEQAQLPNVQLFTIMSPSGKKFLDIMVKLSVLVMKETLMKKCQGQVILTPNADTKHVNAGENVTILTDMHNAKIKDLQNELLNLKLANTVKLQEITREINVVQQECTELEAQLKLQKESLEGTDLSGFRQRFAAIYVEMENLESTTAKVKLSLESLDDIKNEKNVIVVREELLKTSKNKINDLIQFADDYNKTLRASDVLPLIMNEKMNSLLDTIQNIKF